jgi:hypothetical protein
MNALDMAVIQFSCFDERACRMGLQDGCRMRTHADRRGRNKQTNNTHTH